MAGSWYVIKEGQQEGPYSLEEIRQEIKQGNLKQGNYVWNPEYTRWLRTEQAPELQDLLPPAAPPYPGPLPSPTFSSPSGQPAAAGGARGKRLFLKWGLVAFLILLITGGSLFLWRSLSPAPNPIAKALFDTAPDEAATAAVNSFLAIAGAERGVEALVIPLPEEKGSQFGGTGNVVLLNINHEESFEPAATMEELQMQVMQVARAVADANRLEELGIVLISCSIFDKNLPAASMIVSTAAVENWVDELISDEEFIGKTRFRVHDLDLLRALAAQ